MAGSKDNSAHWEKIVHSKLGDATKHPDFEEDWALLWESQSIPNLLQLNLEQFVQKYRLPKSALRFLKRGILLEEFNVEDIPPPILIVSEVDNEVLPSDEPKIMMESYRLYLRESRPKGRVLLDITADTKREDIDHFLDKNFKALIKPKLKLLDRDRITATKPKLNGQFYKVAKLYKEKTATGKTRGIKREIEVETGYKPLDVKKHVEEYRSHKKYDLLTLEDYGKIMGQNQQIK